MSARIIKQRDVKYHLRVTRGPRRYVVIEDNGSHSITDKISEATAFDTSDAAHAEIKRYEGSRSNFPQCFVVSRAARASLDG